jgi:hypothetical protein
VVDWYWVPCAFFLGVGIGLVGIALCVAAGDLRHERRVNSDIAGRSYWESTRKEV